MDLKIQASQDSPHQPISQQRSLFWFGKLDLPLSDCWKVSSNGLTGYVWCPNRSSCNGYPQCGFVHVSSNGLTCYIGCHNRSSCKSYPQCGSVHVSSNRLVTFVVTIGTAVMLKCFSKTGGILVFKKIVEFLEFYGFTLRFRTFQAKKISKFFILIEKFHCQSIWINYMNWQ